MNKVVEALGKLDPSNDNHWTSDGLPRIDTVRMFAGNQALTREAITAAIPNFSRLIAAAAMGKPPVAQATAPVAEAAPVVAAPVVSEKPKSSSSLEEAQAKLQAALTARNEANANVQEAQDAVDAIINEQYAHGAQDETAVAIRGYLDGQRALLDERTRRAKVLHESGVTLNDIQALIPQKAPIDIALSRKR